MEDVLDIETQPEAEEKASSMTAEQKQKLAVFTAVAVLVEIAAVAFIQLVGVYGYGVNLLETVTARVGWSAYSSGMGIGFALLIAGIALYARAQGMDITGWSGFSSGLSRICAALLVETPLLGQVNTYTAMCKGLGAGVENAALVGAKISEALVSTICGYAAFSVLLVVYMFALKGRGEDNENS